jgi:class 3 adenylate cyclase
VNLASRMESHGVADGIQVGRTTYERLRAEYVFGEARQVLLKGHGMTTVYLLLERRNACSENQR